MSSGNTCSQCWYWSASTTTCRRYPPQALLVTGSTASYEIVWPPADAGEWCGEFRPEATAGWRGSALTGAMR